MELQSTISLMSNRGVPKYPGDSDISLFFRYLTGPIWEMLTVSKIFRIVWNGLFLISVFFYSSSTNAGLRKCSRSYRTKFPPWKLGKYFWSGRALNNDNGLDRTNTKSAERPKKIKINTKTNKSPPPHNKKVNHELWRKKSKNYIYRNNARQCSMSKWAKIKQIIRVDMFAYR